MLAKVNQQKVWPHENSFYGLAECSENPVEYGFSHFWVYMYMSWHCTVLVQQFSLQILDRVDIRCHWSLRFWIRFSRGLSEWGLLTLWIGRLGINGKVLAIQYVFKIIWPLCITIQIWFIFVSNKCRPVMDKRAFYCDIGDTRHLLGEMYNWRPIPVSHIMSYNIIVFLHDCLMTNHCQCTHFAKCYIYLRNWKAMWAYFPFACTFP